MSVYDLVLQSESRGCALEKSHEASQRIINDAYEYIEYGMVANEFHTDVKEKSISVSRGVNVSGGQTGAVSAEAIQT